MYYNTQHSSERQLPGTYINVMGKEHIKFQSYNMSTMYCNLLDCLHIDNEMPQDTDLLHL